VVVVVAAAAAAAAAAFVVVAVFLIVKRSAQVQYNYNTTAVQEFFFLYCSYIALVWIPTIQRYNTSFPRLAENLQATCSSCKKLVLQLYCTCVDLFKLQSFVEYSLPTVNMLSFFCRGFRLSLPVC